MSNQQEQNASTESHEVKGPDTNVIHGDSVVAEPALVSLAEFAATGRTLEPSEDFPVVTRFFERESALSATAPNDPIKDDEKLYEEVLDVVLDNEDEFVSFDPDALARRKLAASAGYSQIECQIGFYNSLCGYTLKAGDLVSINFPNGKSLQKHLHGSSGQCGGLHFMASFEGVRLPIYMSQLGSAVVNGQLTTVKLILPEEERAALLAKYPKTAKKLGLVRPTVEERAAKVKLSSKPEKAKKALVMKAKFKGDKHKKAAKAALAAEREAAAPKKVKKKLVVSAKPTKKIVPAKKVKPKTGKLLKRK